MICPVCKQKHERFVVTYQTPCIEALQRALAEAQAQRDALAKALESAQIAMENHDSLVEDCDVLFSREINEAIDALTAAPAPEH